MNTVRQTNQAPLHPVHKQMPSMRECLLKQPFSPSNVPSKTMPPSITALFSNQGNNHIGSSPPERNRKPSIPEMSRWPLARIPQLTTMTLSGDRLGSGEPMTDPVSSAMMTSYKRPCFFEGQDGFSYKRKRIAHSKRPVDQICHQPVENKVQRGPDIDSHNIGIMNPRNMNSTGSVEVSAKVMDLNSHLFTNKKHEEFSDYKKQYVTIRDVDQRREYRADFKADHAEYKNLLCIIDKVSERFSHLEERLKQENKMSFRCKEIKKQIIREYKENKFELIRKKRRFQYLHFKLSHIKGLITEYDQDLKSIQY